MPKAGDHIVVVGGTSGLGFSIAKAADALGAKVAIAGRGRERAAEIARSISPRVAGLHIDLEDSSSIDQALAGGEAIDHLVLTPIYGGAHSIKEFKAEEAARRAHQDRRLRGSRQQGASPPEAHVFDRPVRRGGEGQTLSRRDHGHHRQRRHCRHGEDAGGGTRADPGERNFAGPRGRFAEMAEASPGGRGPCRRSDTIANADPPAADDRGHCPWRILSHGQSRGERHRPRARRRHPAGVTSECNCQLLPSS